MLLIGTDHDGDSDEEEDEYVCFDHKISSNR